jgi:SAM-dependent methyltransferase
MSNDYYCDPRVAEAYDAEHGPSSQAVVVDDVPFYVALAREAAAAGQRVLELGCGTGRVTLPIAQAGVEVVGLDNAAPMLDVARRKADALGLRNVSWLQADMAGFALDGRFGLVIIPFRSFLLLLTVEQQKACLARIHHHLVDGGRLALNVFNPDPVIIARWLTEQRGAWRPLNNDLERSGLENVEYRIATQGLVWNRADGRPGDAGAIVARVERNLRMRYVFRYEMEHLLTLSGFAVEALYGWFDRRPFDDQSSEMVWIARKI